MNKYPESLPKSTVVGMIFLTSAFLFVLEPEALGGVNQLGLLGCQRPQHTDSMLVFTGSTSSLMSGSLKLIYLWSSSRCKSQLIYFLLFSPPKFYISNCLEGHTLFRSM